MTLCVNGILHESLPNRRACCGAGHFLDMSDDRPYNRLKEKKPCRGCSWVGNATRESRHSHESCSRGSGEGIRGEDWMQDQIRQDDLW